MAVLIGTDEAGYGPSLGPLVITATKWECPQQESDLYHLLNDVVTDSPKLIKDGAKKSAGGNSTHPQILIADSKVACRSGNIGSLELPVLVLLHAIHGKTPKTLPELVSMVMPTVSPDFFRRHFWLNEIKLCLPLSASKFGLEKIPELASRFQAVCDENQTKLCDVKSTIVLPPEFNEAVVNCGNKASLLSELTLGLVANFIRSGKEDTLINCDKHGGRNYYGKLISKVLTSRPISSIIESPALSVYRWDEAGRALEIRFTPKGEDQLPVALASMVSKYLRELFMQAWNDFWRTHIPEIKPTKGYPQDAKRFLAEIEQVASAERYDRNDYLRNC